MLTASMANAHEVPRHVAVRAYVASLPDRVRLLVRIPMDAVRDVEFPLLAARARPDGPRPGVIDGAVNGSASGSVNGSVDVARLTPFLHDAARLWVADGVLLRDGPDALPSPDVIAVRAALPADRAFDTYTSALHAVQHVPLADSVRIPPLQLALEVLLEVPVTRPVTDLIIEPRWAHLGVQTTTVMRLELPDGGERFFTWDGDPGAVRLDPSWTHAAARFVGQGALHMFGGLDHVLFVLCLVLPFRRIRPLIGIVTAFTIAHSITLATAALGYAPDVQWFSPLVEVIIAASIVLLALENIVGAKLERRWMMAFVFGLVHGFGFSSVLQEELQFAGGHLLTALAAFNVGVELAQVTVLLVAVPVLNWVFAKWIPERTGVIVASALIAHEAWHWMRDRSDALRGTFAWPAFDIDFWLMAIRVAMVLLVLLGVMWAISGVMTRLQQPRARARMQALVLLLLAGALWTSAPTTVDAQSVTRTTMAGVYTADQANKGKEVFASSCLGCHTTASHMGTAFEIKWFGRPLFDLYDYLSQLMPKTAPGSLTEDEYVWVTAYILRLNRMPAGKTELSAEPSWLKSVRVDSVKTPVARDAGSGGRNGDGSGGGTGGGIGGGIGGGTSTRNATGGER